MAPRLTCAQGHYWEGGAGGSSACPVCGGGAVERGAPGKKSDAVPEGLLPAVLDSLADGLVVADAGGRFLLFNAAAERLPRRPTGRASTASTTPTASRP